MHMALPTGNRETFGSQILMLSVDVKEKSLNFAVSDADGGSYIHCQLRTTEIEVIVAPK